MNGIFPGPDRAHSCASGKPAILDIKLDPEAITPARRPDPQQGVRRLPDPTRVPADDIRAGLLAAGLLAAGATALY